MQLLNDMLFKFKAQLWLKDSDSFYFLVPPGPAYFVRVSAQKIVLQ